MGMTNRAGAGLFLVIALLCLSLVAWTEWLDWRNGGEISSQLRAQKQNPSKWRLPMGRPGVAQLRSAVLLTGLLVPLPALATVVGGTTILVRGCHRWSRLVGALAALGALGSLVIVLARGYLRTGVLH